jgi:uncharacterized caspase-like protein
MIRRRTFLGSLAAVALARPRWAAAAQRVALVIGNSDYRYVPRLPNPGNDARLIASTLGSLGFTLVGGGAQLDLDKARFDQALRAFGRAIQGAEVALFYYSGHGLQVDGVNWLVPISANPSQAQDLDFEMVNSDLVLRQTEGANTKLNVVILDACRNNPFAGRGLRSTGGGLAQMQAPPGTLISYATQPGAVALDGDGRDSPYSAALANTLRQPGLDIFRVFNQVGLLVEQATRGQQQPWVSASPISGEFYFAGVAPGAVAPAPLALAPAVPATVQRDVPTASFDGSYRGSAAGIPNICGGVDITITVAGGVISGKAVLVRRNSFGSLTSDVSGRIGPDGSTVLVLQKNAEEAPGAPIPGRFVDGKFEGLMGGKTPQCRRAVSLARN